MIYLNNYGIAVLSNNTFTNMRASGDGYGIYSTSGRLEIHQCTFLVSTLVNGQTIASTIYLVSTHFTGSNLNITYSSQTLTPNKANEGGGIYCQNCASFNLMNSYFANLQYAMNGGAISLRQTIELVSNSSNILSISNSTFINNSAYSGGAIYTSIVGLSITN